MEEYRHLLGGDDAKLWETANSKEIARLAQGRADNSIIGTNTLHFKHPKEIPTGRKPTYLRVVAAYRPTKDDPHRVRWTVGGNNISYPGVTYTPNADIITAKLLFNSIISTKNAKFLGIDIKDFYLNTPMQRYEYMLIPTKMIPKDIMDEYGLHDKQHNGMILGEIQKGMYGLPQAGRLAYDKLIKHLAKGGYHPTPHTPGLFRHRTNNTTFCLIVDDFGVKYTNNRDAQHLIDHLNSQYKTTVDWEGRVFCGMHLKWDYTSLRRSVELTIPNYVKRALIRFMHVASKSSQHSPHPFTPPTYGAKQQYADPITDTTLSPSEKKWIEEVVGVFLYYARAIDSTMLLPIGSIASAKSTDSYANLKHRINHFLDYAATHPDSILKYYASDMHLWAASDASYLCESRARSRAGGTLYLSDKPHFPILPDSEPPTPNGHTQVISKIIDTVMSSAQEAENGTGFITAKEIMASRVTLDEMGHQQTGPTPL